MKVTITGPAEKRCPYKDETDIGTITLTFSVPTGDAPELHGVAKQLAATSDERISHEDYTRAAFATWQHAGCIRVETTWGTAGLTVVCEIE